PTREATMGESQAFRAIVDDTDFDMGLAMDIGSRSEQQDFAFASGNVFAVFDGAGGEGDGAEASHIAAHTLADIYRATACPSLTTQPTLSIAVELVHEQLVRLRQDRNSITTIAGVRVENNAIEVVWCGDSRVYILLKNGQLLLASRDHGQEGYLWRALGSTDRDPDSRLYGRCPHVRSEIEPVRIL